MNISQTLLETTLSELFADKSSKIYFHGASNDKGQDPDRKTIDPPSPEHPFFVTDDIWVAKEYANIPTDSKGRLSEKINKSRIRIYLLRLSDKAKFFDYTKQDLLYKLFKRIGIPSEYFKPIQDAIVIKSTSFMFFATWLQSDIDKVGKILEDLIGDGTSVSKSYDELVNKLISKTGLLFSNRKNFAIAVMLLWPFFRNNYLNGDFGDSTQKEIDGRRIVKTFFFKHILEMGYNVFVEKDTSGNNPNAHEYGVLDISAIKDICPVPFKVEDIVKMQKDFNKHNFDSDNDDPYADGFLESANQLDEAGLIISKKSGAYPRSNNILIMAGGPGSGKSFILDKLLLFDGKVFNPDITLQQMIDLGKKNPNWTVARRFQKEYGIELKDVDLKNSSDANKIYEFLDKIRLHYAKEAVFFKSVQGMKDKPNVIFDVTLRHLKTLEFIGLYSKLGGYDPKNVNLVWVLNDVQVALDQNARRNRSVDPEYLKFSHKGVAKSFKTIIDYSDRFSEIVDGDIWIVFNKKGVDVKTTVSFRKKTDTDNEYVANVNIDPKAENPYVALHMKERGRPARKWSEIEKPLLDKIMEYSGLKELK